MVKVDKEFAEELQERLVKTLISFCKEKGISSVEELYRVDFSFDSIPESTEAGYWTIDSDSWIKLEHLKKEGDIWVRDLDHVVEYG